MTQQWTNLKIPKGAKILRKRTSFHNGSQQISNGTAKRIGYGSHSHFPTIESGLRINNTDYKTVRRNLFNYDSPVQQRQENDCD